MVYIKSREEIKLMKESGRILALIIKSLCDSVKPGMKTKTIEQTVKPHNYGIVRDLVGHGIGKDLHEEPHVPNFVSSDKSPEIKEGMVIAIEPMITTGTWKVEVAKDKFTYKTKDSSMSAHFEHTVAITKNGPEILTK